MNHFPSFSRMISCSGMKVESTSSQEDDGTQLDWKHLRQDTGYRRQTSRVMLSASHFAKQGSIWLGWSGHCWFVELLGPGGGIHHLWCDKCMYSTLWADKLHDCSQLEAIPDKSWLLMMTITLLLPTTLQSHWPEVSYSLCWDSGRWTVLALLINQAIQLNSIGEFCTPGYIG